MAEFCLECWNKINERNDKESDYIMSEELDLCEGCGKWKHVIVAKKGGFYNAISLFDIILRLIFRLLKSMYSAIRKMVKKQ